MSTTSADSPDTLPARYSIDNLANWLFRKLGYPVWSVELTRQQALDAIQQAVDYYSLYRPQVLAIGLQMQPNKFEYFADRDLGQGVVQVDFLEPNPIPQAFYWGNLIEPAPIIRTGIDEYDMYLRWRKTWMRVTSVQPQWQWDDVRKALYIHNPLTNYQAGVTYMRNYPDTESLDQVGRIWVRDYALAKAKITYGEILQKFQGAIPGPVKDLQLDQGKTARGEKDVADLELKLHNMQWNAGAAISVD